MQPSPSARTRCAMPHFHAMMTLAPFDEDPVRIVQAITDSGRRVGGSARRSARAMMTAVSIFLSARGKTGVLLRRAFLARDR